MTKAQADFISEIAEAAHVTHGDTGIPASITIAQAILESGWGKTRLAMEDFNYFGIKALPGEDYCEFATAEYINGEKEIVESEFARFASPLECFRAHATLLQGKRYAPAMKCISSPMAFASMLQNCGYSTNRPPLASKPPYYADVLMDLVKEFNLRNYDSQPTPEDPARAA